MFLQNAHPVSVLRWTSACLGIAPLTANGFHDATIHTHRTPLHCYRIKAPDHLLKGQDGGTVVCTHVPARRNIFFLNNRLISRLFMEDSSFYVWYQMGSSSHIPQFLSFVLGEKMGQKGGCVRPTAMGGKCQERRRLLRDRCEWFYFGTELITA